MAGGDGISEFEMSILIQPRFGGGESPTHLINL